MNYVQRLQAHLCVSVWLLIWEFFLMNEAPKASKHSLQYITHATGLAFLPV